jgi:hypothetical protein
MPPKKDKKKKKPMKRTQTQKGKGQSQKQTQIVNISLARPKGRARAAPKPAVPINMVRLNEPPQQLVSQPVNQIMREPLKEVVDPSKLLYEGTTQRALAAAEERVREKLKGIEGNIREQERTKLLREQQQKEFSKLRPPPVAAEPRTVFIAAPAAGGVAPMASEPPSEGVKVGGGRGRPKGAKNKPKLLPTPAQLLLEMEQRRRDAEGK